MKSESGKPLSYIQVENLRKGFEMPVFEQLSFTVPCGSIFALRGANGSGKSSLLKIMAGLLSADEGEIFLVSEADGDVHTRLRSALPKNIYLSQDIVLFEDFTVQDNMRIFSSHFGKNKPEEKELFDYLSLRLGLKDLWRKPLRKLSGGQKRRVHLVAALLCDAALYLLDEPDAGIDLHYLAAIAEVLQEMARSGRTIILSTHNQSFLSVIADGQLELAAYSGCSTFA